jgi:hypothetical protein
MMPGMCCVDSDPKCRVSLRGVNFLLMKVRVLLLCLTLLCTAYRSVAKKHQDYATYFTGILAAEHSLAQDDLPAALEAYVALFRQFDFVFARDAYNALQLAILAEWPEQRDALLIRCARAGVPADMLSRNMLVHAAYAHDEKHFQELFAKGNALYLHRIDTALRTEILQRYKLEQANKGKDNYRQICTDNFNRIRELSEGGRYPGEQLIGVDDNLGYGFAFPTLLHYPYAYVLLYDYLWSAVHAGQLQPLALIYLYGFNQTRTSVLYTADIPVDTQHFKVDYNALGLELSNEAAIDSARKKVWLRPMAETPMIKAVARKHGMDFREGW